MTFEEYDEYLKNLQLARSSNASHFILKKLFVENGWTIKYEVVMNPNCPIDILEDNLNDRDVIYTILKNPKCPVYLLERSLQLNIDIAHYGIKLFVLQNPNCTAEISERLSNDHIETIKNIIRDRRCPFYFLKKIYKKYENLRPLIQLNVNWRLSDFN